jgi:SHS2 domain-containing protein
MKYKFLKHTADVKFRAYGATLNEMFENSAAAMFKSMYPGRVEEKIKMNFSVRGKDLESLLYGFLEKLIVLLDSKGFFVSRVKVRIDKKNLKLVGEAFGDKASDYDVAMDVKAVTYSEMFVKQIGGKWVCQVVLDV